MKCNFFVTFSIILSLGLLVAKPFILRDTPSIEHPATYTLKIITPLTNDQYKASYQNKSLFLTCKTKLEAGSHLTLKNTPIHNLCKSRNHDVGTFDEYLIIQGFHGKANIRSENIIDHQNHFSLYAPIIQSRNALLHNLQRTIPPEYDQLTGALLFGATIAPLDAELNLLFRMAGIIHIMVVSGSQVAILASVCAFLFKRQRKAKPLLTILVLLAFTLITGAGASIVRAFFMTTYKLIAELLERDSDISIGISLSALLQILLNIRVVFDLGFQLSYAATIGLIFLTPLIESKLAWVGKPCRLIAQSIAPTLLTTPIIMYSFHTLQPYSIIMNIIVLPFIEFIVVWGYATTAISFICPAIGIIANIPIVLCLLGIKTLAIANTYLPWHSIAIHSFHWIWFIVAGSIAYVFRRNIILASIGPLCILLLGSFWHEPACIRFIDVGQGDCILIHSKRNAYLIDCGTEKGSATQTIKGVLAAEGITKLTTVFITHEHRDHISSRADLVNAGLVEKVITNNCPEQIVDGPLTIQKIFHDRSQAQENDRSLVLLITMYDQRILLTGDASQNIEPYIQQKITYPINILKVGHHGSKTSTSEPLVWSTLPRYAVISVGKNNRYKHPHSEALNRLKVCSSILRTDELGGITFYFSPTSLRLKTSL